jgi:hypothetical protein
LPDRQEERVTGPNALHATLAASPEAISSSMPEEDAQGWGGGVVVAEEKRGVEEQRVIDTIQSPLQGPKDRAEALCGNSTLKAS